MDESKIEELIGFWNVRPSSGHWRIVSKFRHGPNPGPRGELASSLSWSNAQAQCHVAVMLGLHSESNLSDMLDAPACARALSLGVAKAFSEAFDSSWTEAPCSVSHLITDSSTSHFIVFNEHDMASIAAGFESIALSSGGLVRHSCDELSNTAKNLSVSGPPVIFRPASFRSTRLALDPHIDLFWAGDSKGYYHRIDARALAFKLGLPLSCVLAQGDEDLSLIPSFLNMEGVQRRAQVLGDKLFALGCSVRFGTQRHNAPIDFGLAELQAFQEASLLSAAIHTDQHLPVLTPKASKRRTL